MLTGELVRGPIVEKILETHPDWSSQGFICIADLNRYRADYVKDVITADKGELSVLEEQVVDSMKKQELLSRNINVEYDRQRNVGEVMADRIAAFGGSWLFIGLFCGVLLIWLKAELEIRHLHEKIDHLLMNQWQRLMEIQQIQMELMQDLAQAKKPGRVT